MQITDSIYGRVSIQDRDIIELIKTKAFQRLAHIKQQGHTYYLHPNATHTRIEHSIGVYVLVNKVITHLTTISDIDLTEYEQKVVSIVALLHDIGHGPYSHCFQRISGQDHGDWTIQIIQEDRDVRTILERTPNLLEGVIQALSEENSFPIIDELLFCSLGMDQLDFWNRDLYYSSLQVERIPIEKLISTMRMVNQKLVIEESGVPYIEHLVKVKSALYHNGFGHPFVVGKDLLFQLIFQKIKEDNISFYSPLLQNFFQKREKELEVKDFVHLVDEVILNEMKYFAVSEHEQLAELAQLYLSKSRSLDWESGLEGDFACYKKEVRYISEVMKEKKGYSSYIGGIYINKNSHFMDILELSKYIKEMVALPKREYMYYL
ncbi:HD domain-containing protein [Bacillus sp. 166amftsu]|uniref:HD domain-containing protein n=1 Tax=Bacillus sp. 166amftsu TaxID=1761753 RepID=UPI000896DC83|nr:HD domain-containing protein [Bacillus sp. 166amftsu]SDY86772.1 HD superfamily phosphohydrolase [Bacillus sp. 166amftsu]